jgi:CheY-like chemotaxis protein
VALRLPQKGAPMTVLRHPRPSLTVARPRISSRPPSPPRGPILVVDDHDDTRELLLTILKTAGYEVSLADDGDTALRCYRARPADIVLMDLNMPRKDGVSTIRELRAEFPGVTIVAMTGDTGIIWRDALDEARAAGANLTLRKPLEPWLLLRTIEGLMAARKTLPAASLHRSA